jgi:hypothetical protein
MRCGTEESSLDSVAEVSASEAGNELAGLADDGDGLSSAQTSHAD